MWTRELSIEEILKKLRIKILEIKKNYDNGKMTLAFYNAANKRLIKFYARAISKKIDEIDIEIEKDKTIYG